MALSFTEQAARDQQHFRDFTAARGLNPGFGPAPNAYNVTMPPKPSYNTAAWMNDAPGMQASSFGLKAPPPPTPDASAYGPPRPSYDAGAYGPQRPSMGERMGQWASQQPKVDPMAEAMSRSAANPPPPSGSAYGPPRPEYAANEYGPFRRADTHRFSPEAQAWQQGVREPYTGPGGLPPNGPAPGQAPPAGLMKEAINPPSALTRGLRAAGTGLRVAGEALGPVGMVFAAENASRGLERMTGQGLDPRTAAAMGIPQIPENPTARTPEEIYRTARAANPPPKNGMTTPGNIDLHNRPVVRNPDGSISTVRSMSFNDQGREVLIPTVAADGSGLLSPEAAIEQYRKTGQHLGMFDTPEHATAYSENLHNEQAREYVRPESPSGPVGPTIPTGPVGLPSAGTTEAVNNAFAGGLNQPNIAPAPRQPINMQPETGGPRSAEQMAQLNQEAASAAAAQRVDPNNVQPGQGYVRAADGRTWEINGDQIRGYGLNGAPRAMSGGYAGEPRAADREAAMQRSAEATKFMDRERAAADYRYNVGRAMEYRDPTQRAMMLKTASDIYQTRVGGIPNAQTDAELKKQELVNQGGVQEQEVQNQGGLAVAKQQGLTQEQVNRMQADSRVRSAEIRAQTSKDLRNQQGEEMMALDVFDPDTGQKTGQKLVPKFQRPQQPQQLTDDQKRAAALAAYQKAPNKLKEIRQWLMGNKITDHGFLGAS